MQFAEKANKFQTVGPFLGIKLNEFCESSQPQWVHSEFCFWVSFIQGITDAYISWCYKRKILLDDAFYLFICFTFILKMIL